ncbi:MAG: rhamnulose-1-phosphate aldolase [Clostridiales bacterium]|jgi:rhamnulose-1-phosphate aldolase|nr:rhamnulose-1-phosphate aldolase [Clostridiales bacterium]
MDLLKEEFIREFIDITNEGYQKGWHERNGGNASYRIKPEEIEHIKPYLTYDKPYDKIGVSVPNLKGEYFLITGSGKYFRKIKNKPDENLAIIEIDSSGQNYRLVWGLTKGGRPTSELPTHLMNHSVKKDRTHNSHRVIYHCHPANVIALTFVLPLEDAVFTRELWEMATECPVVFPDGIGVVDWMVPGGRDIALSTSKLMEKYNVAIWAHHGIFCSGEDFDETFGLVETVEKSAEILVKVLSMVNEKRQTITPENLRDLAKDFQVSLPEEFLQ